MQVWLQIATRYGPMRRTVTWDAVPRSGDTVAVRVGGSRGTIFATVRRVEWWPWHEGAEPGRAQEAHVQVHLGLAPLDVSYGQLQAAGFKEVRDP